MTQNTTENYALPQWESSDLLRREDFNEAFQLVDAALDGLSGQGLHVYTGIYIGTGAASARTITIGTRPKFLLVVPRGTTAAGSGYYSYGLFARDFVVQQYAAGNTQSGTFGLISLIDSGFRISENSDNTSIGFNRKDLYYGYVALY